MNKKSLSVMVIASVVIVLIIFAAERSHRADGADIRIGAVLGLTGYAADDSLGVKRGIDLAVSDLAEQGVLVDVRYEDDATDPKQTISSVRNLEAIYKPQAIIGPIWSYLEDAAAPVLTRDRLVSFAPADTSEFTTGGPYIFHGAVRNDRIAPVAAKWLVDHRAQKIAILVSKDAWGASVGDAFKKAALASGGSIVLYDAMLTGDETASATAIDLAKAKALGAQAIMFTGYDDGDIALAKRRYELGIGIPVLVHTREYEKLLASNSLSADQVRGIDYLSANISPDFVAKFRKAYGADPGNYSDRAYDGLMMLVQAIRNTQGAGGDSIVAYLRNNPYQGFGGTYQFDSKGDIAGGEWVIRPVAR